jgi:hypothetical protein
MQKLQDHSVLYGAVIDVNDKSSVKRIEYALLKFLGCGTGCEDYGNES